MAEGNSLSIYGQSQNTGYLYAGRNHSKSSNAGIGGDPNYWNPKTGTIAIYGGKVKAEVRGEYVNAAAAIGGGYAGEGGSVTLAGGRIEAVTKDTVQSLGGFYFGAYATYNKEQKGEVTLTWNSADMSVKTTSINGNENSLTTITFQRPFALSGTNTLATKANMGGKTIVPASVVTFDGNGGTSSMDACALPGGGRYTLPACGFTPPTGQYFIGWQVGDDTENVLPPDSQIEVPFSVEQYQVTLKAIYADEAQFSFDGNGLTGSMDPVYTHESSYTLPEPTQGFTLPDHAAFEGWELDGDGLHLLQPGDSEGWEPGPRLPALRPMAGQGAGGRCLQRRRAGRGESAAV